MRIILSPAKKMREDPDFLAPAALPAFLPQTNQLLAALKERTPQQLQALWRCNDAIAAQNLRRLENQILRQAESPGAFGRPFGYVRRCRQTAGGKQSFGGNSVFNSGGDGHQ